MLPCSGMSPDIPFHRRLEITEAHFQIIEHFPGLIDMGMFNMNGTETKQSRLEHEPLSLLNLKSLLLTSLLNYSVLFKLETPAVSYF